MAAALNHILQEYGGAYFPYRVIQPYLAAGSLHLVPAAPEFTRPAFFARQNWEDPVLVRAVERLHAIARADTQASCW